MSIRNKKGFTIVELLIVIAIIAILVLLAVPKLMGMADKSKMANIQNDVKVHETIILAKLAEDENFILSSNWEILDNSELSRKKDEFAIFSKSGYVDKKYLFEDKHYKLGSELINSNLKGEFIVSEKGLVFYEDDSLRKVIGGKISPEEEINKTLALDNTLETKLEVKTITQSNDNFANVYKYSQNGFVGELIKKGNVKTEVVSGSYTPSDSKRVTGQASSNYNSGGYSGTLSRVQTGGSYTPAQTKNVSGQSSSYYNSGGYSGTLSSYTEQSWVPPHSKTVSHSATFTYASDCPSSGTASYNIGGYSGTLSQVSCTANKAANSHTSYYSGTVTKPGYYETRTYYRGTVTKPAADTRTYAYEGTVTKPAVDTRVYSYTQEYEGLVEKGVMPKFPEHIEEQGVKLYPKGEPILNNKTNKYELTYTGIKPEEDNREWGKK